MAFLHFRTLKCPNCNFLLDMHIFSISSGIGSEAVICRKCKTEFLSGRHEWPFKSKKDLLLFALKSIALIGFGSLIAANFFYSAIEHWNGNNHPKNLPTEDLFFQKIFWVCCLALSLFQAFRISQSVKRNESEPVATTSSLYSFDFMFGAQLKILIIILLLTLVGWGKYTLTH